jgi:AcrR family transcriptional regulator
MPELPDDHKLLSARLLDAGRRLLDSAGSGDLDEARICAAAGLPLGAIHASFGDWDGYRCALLATLIDEVRDRVARMTDNMPSGIERLKLALETYLEANVQRPALRRLLSELRFSERGVEVIRSRVAGFGVVVGVELRALGRPHPQATARLLTAAVTEIAQAEHEAGARVPALRRTLLRYLDQSA